MADHVADAGVGKLTANRDSREPSDHEESCDMQVTESEQSADNLNADIVGEDCASESNIDGLAAGSAQSLKEPMPTRKYVTVFGLVVVVALAILGGWFAFRIHQLQQAQDQRNQFLQVARQGALNLTTIDWQHADADVHRILDGATGEFYGDFAKRSQPFIEAVQKSKAKTAGTVVEAGLMSETTDTAQALVAVSVQTTNSISPDQVKRSWRLRIDVQKIGDQVKVSKVEFVL